MCFKDHIEIFYWMMANGKNYYNTGTPHTTSRVLLAVPVFSICIALIIHYTMLQQNLILLILCWDITGGWIYSHNLHTQI